MTESKIPWLKNDSKVLEAAEEFAPAEFGHDDDVAENITDDVNDAEIKKYVPEYGYDALYDDMIFPS